MSKPGRCEVKIKWDGIPIVEEKNISLDGLDKLVRDFKRKVN